MEDKKNNELRSRREFFKKAAKGTLPILSAIVLASTPILSQAAKGCVEGYCSNCNNSCTNGCRNGCHRSCATECSLNCQGKSEHYYGGDCEGCRGLCGGCSGLCSGFCKGSCYRSSYTV